VYAPNTESSARGRSAKKDGLVAVVDEVGRDDDRQVAIRAGHDQFAEVVRLEEVAPLRVG
jgi:hypothetical protein